MIQDILAGPILRRVTVNRVCVWIATSKFTNLQLEVLSKNGLPLSESAQVEHPSSTVFPEQCCQLGAHLFVYLLQARCKDQAGFPRDTLLYYRLLEDGKPLDLSELSYFDADDPSLPDHQKLPSFFIPEELQKFLHGSCRKPHGGGDNPDALSYGDDLLASTYTDLNKRPAVLLLSGDQIYADDVAVSVASMLKKQAAKLTGKHELLPARGPYDDKKLTWVNPHMEALGSRKELLKKYHSEFSSEESQNHLLSFGEFAAMYIYVFGNAQGWLQDNNWESVANTGITKEAFYQQCASVQEFEKTLQKKIRRLLANIPTYMLLDDHDVTDDWNITNDWYDKVGGSDLGKRVVSNALAAYFAFQGWGNDPDNFDKDLRRTISQQLLDNGHNKNIGKRYDLHTWAHRCWSFSVPTLPPIIAIDSRTQRESTPDSYLPVLLDRYARDWLRLEWNKLNILQPCYPIFITSTPVMGNPAVESVENFLYWFFNWLEEIFAKKIEKLPKQEKGRFAKKAINYADIEAWTSNKKSLNTLMRCLQDMEIKRCVFLSGDVHYGFAAVGRSIQYGKDSKNEIECYQLLSSPLKNNLDKKLRKAFNAIINPSIWNRLEKWLSPYVHLLESNHDSDNGPKPRAHDTCNLGLVTFNNGQPLEHILLQSREYIGWNLQPEKDFLELKKPTLLQSIWQSINGLIS